MAAVLVPPHLTVAVQAAYQAADINSEMAISPPVSDNLNGEAVPSSSPAPTTVAGIVAVAPSSIEDFDT